VALNKADMPDAAEIIGPLRERLEQEGRRVFEISALAGTGVQDLVYAISGTLAEIPVPTPAEADSEVMRFRAPEQNKWEVESTPEGGFVVRGKSIERLVAMTDMGNEASVRRMQRILEKNGIVSRLRDLGAEDGVSVRIGDVEFDFLD
jgi:GTP-binding protein